MTEHYDVTVIGGGIVGLAHAWAAARRNLRVGLFDRSPRATGATVRNFGMIWPIGQPAGDRYATALRSRGFWSELGSHGVLNVDECGAVHLAHRPDELAVLEEFCGGGSHDSRMMSRSETLRVAPIANSEGLLGGMWSPTELRVDPRTAADRICGWLTDRFDVTAHFETPITACGTAGLTAADGRKWTADRIIVCSGSDLRTLYPETLATSGLKLCKLQMLRTVAQPNMSDHSPHIASGLTLRHYTSFEGCPTLAALRERVADEAPELDRYGIHVMATRAETGEFILGDSHEYGDDISPFDKTEIDDLILRELRKVVHLPNWSITQRWHGVYAKHPDLPIFEAEPEPGVHVCLGPGGAGMTMSFGLAENAWCKWEGEPRE